MLIAEVVTMRSMWQVGVLCSVGVLVGCGGTSTHHDAADPDTGAALAGSSGAASVGSSGGGAGGQATAEPAVHEVAEFCAERACPASDSDVPLTCRACAPAPGGLPSECTENIFGGTLRYVSSCGGYSFEVHFGFDSTIWNFDADGQLIGVAWGSDTSSQRYGRQCERAGDSEDLCLTGSAGAGAGGAGGVSGVE